MLLFTLEGRIWASSRREHVDVIWNSKDDKKDKKIEEWISKAKVIAKKYHTIIIGTSHADGSYRNCGISIPIPYFIDSSGEEIFISKIKNKSHWWKVPMIIDGGCLIW